MLVRGAIFAEGAPKEIGSDRKCARSISGRPDHGWRPRAPRRSAGYGETVVLEDMNLEVAPGESVSVIGRNGVGKTTLLATVMGHTTLHKGEVRSRQDPQRDADLSARAAGIGFVPQEREIFPSLTVRENLDVGARPGDGPTSACSSCSRTSPSASATRAISFPAASSRCFDRARTANQSVRAADGRADRGPGAGDRRGADRRAGQLRGEGELSIILVEQNSRVAFEFSERSVVMDKGRIVYDGASKPLRDDPERLAQLIGVSE